MKKFSLLAIAFLTLFTMSFAQTEDNRWNVGLHFNLNAYQGDLGNGFFDFDEIWEDQGVGLSVGRYLSPSFDVTGKVTYFHLDYRDVDGTYGKGNGGYADYLGAPYGDWRFNGDMWTATANLKFKFNNGWLIKEDAVVGPFVIGGVGVTRIHSESFRNTWRNSKNYSNLAFYYGGGFNFRITERWNMVLEAGIYNPMTDVYDGIDPHTAPGWTADMNDKGGDAGASDDLFMQYSLGVTYNLGKKKDADGDGVSDRNDKCPNTPAGVAVDEDGCPIDTDGDGVPDYLDKCPNQPGTVDGCPDRDGDGVADKDDDCPDVAGLAQFNGCPDTDGDGVPDMKDECPDTPKGVKVDSKGCPVDTDGDGIPDYLDKCPNEAGVKENNGCPKVDDTPVYYDRVVHFDFNKWNIRRVDIETLNEVATKMMEDTTLTANVAGHTDWIGTDPINQRISERRAEAVKKYLVKKGIDENRIKTVGYGENSPVDTNETSEGRANNRRAEVRIRLK
ncbi:thrombospondin type 3 repeat-containing protein [Balneicella halophila]|uniref:Thrombospondin type 3 repeat-containing protein n=1 Tax=Balneicella halophila TaxID=1537566 RepID=A0A7L4UPS1_BALHA|nr:OmpA family protein [Balneicella halophila]PVX51785.1 thrombospondin type 3 repeat-containing protein [Balneicella halophila]